MIGPGRFWRHFGGGSSMRPSRCMASMTTRAIMSLIMAIAAGSATALSLALAVEAGAQDTERQFGACKAYSTTADLWPIYGAESSRSPAPRQCCTSCALQG